ncbi:MAG TPA: TetR/AcrR family transcriptional regulator [Solirubrobacterales bacterium]|nr:TetR/AcrR family transcriptional regulator [Solirubrobacterales bacterium]
MAPGRGTPREEARRNQRERLFAAMVAVTAEKPYAETSVADLVELSGVSSRSFYQHFADKEECFLATMDEILTTTRRFAEGALEAGGKRGVAETAVQALLAAAIAQPAAAKLCTVTAFSAGEAPRERIGQAVAELSEMLQRGLDELPARERMPEELTQAIFGGVSLVLYRRLARDEIDALSEVGRGLCRWVVSIPPPPGSLRGRSRRLGGAAQPGQPPLAAHVPAERILRAFAAVVAEKGYAAATIAEVAAEAHISQATFYKYFRDKADALQAALDSSGAQMVAAALPAVRREPAWPAAVRVALESLCAFMAAEPVFAYLREVEVYAVGPDAVAQRDSARGEIVAMLAGVAEAEEAISAFDPIAVEATLGAFQSLLYARIQAGRLGALTDVPPIVTYLGLAPVLGAEEAWKVACG